MGRPLAELLLHPHHVEFAAVLAADTAEAAAFCQRIPRGSLAFLEEPIRCENPDAYATLRTMTDVPFAVGEEFASKWDFLPYVERGLTNYARVDVGCVGGLTESRKVAGWCEAHYIDLMPHNPIGPVCTAATVHLAALLGIGRRDEEFFEGLEDALIEADLGAQTAMAVVDRLRGTR